MKKTLLLATTLLASTIAFASTARAGLLFEIYDDGSLVSGYTVTTVSPGFETINTSSTHFTGITVSATGVPSVPSPNLHTVTLDVTSSAAATLTLLVAQTGAVTPSALVGLATDFTVNGLTANNISTSFQNYIDTANVSFGATAGCAPDAPSGACVTSGTASEISLATLDGLSTAAAGGPFTYSLAGGSTISELEAITITFTGASQSASASDAISGEIPEPFSIALLGTGLIGLGVARSRRARR